MRAELRRRRSALTRIRPGDLRRLRVGQTISQFGDEITDVALPTIALVVLHASPLQFGLLTASTSLPSLAIGLLVGAWVDRVRRRTVLLLADLVRFLAILTIPVAALAGVLSIGQLFAVGLTVGTASVFFNSAYQAYLPSIVDAGRITKANAQLTVSETAAQVGGPTVAGGLISLAGAPLAMALDAASFLASVGSLVLIRRPEPRVARRRSSLVPEVREGLRTVFGDPLLRGLTLTSALSNLGRGMALELFLLYAFRGLHLSPGLAGVVLAIGNIGALAGGLACERVTSRLGLGPTLLLGSVLKGLPWVLLPLTLFGAAVPLSVLILAVSSFFVPISNVTTVSIRQTLTPAHLQGRVAATTRTVTRAVLPLSAVLGGALAQLGTTLLGSRLGLASVLGLGGLIWMSATALLPRRRLRRAYRLADLEPGTATGGLRRQARAQQGQAREGQTREGRAEEGPGYPGRAYDAGERGAFAAGGQGGGSEGSRRLARGGGAHAR